MVILTDLDGEFLLGFYVRNCDKLSLNVFGQGVCKLLTSTVTANVVLFLLLLAECSAVRVCGNQNNRKHLDRHNAPPVHVCLYWSAALQGTWSLLLAVL